MNKQNLDEIARETEKREKRREKRKRKRMPVSGARLKQLQRIIIGSSQK